MKNKKFTAKFHTSINEVKEKKSHLVIIKSK